MNTWRSRHRRVSIASALLIRGGTGRRWCIADATIATTTTTHNRIVKGIAHTNIITNCCCLSIAYGCVMEMNCCDDLMILVWLLFFRCCECGWYSKKKRWCWWWWWVWWCDDDFDDWWWVGKFLEICKIRIKKLKEKSVNFCF